QWSYWGGDGQKWQFAGADGSPVTIRNKLNGLVAEVSNQSTANNAPILQYPLHGGASQQWSLVRK
ncbi:MAG TPA: RICIN domain-containing protein, partial [Pseudoduganella sp.]